MDNVEKGAFWAALLSGLLIGTVVAGAVASASFDHQNRLSVARQYHKTDQIFYRAGKYFVQDGNKMTQLPF